MQDWDTQYRTGDTPWELGAPAPPLIDLLDTYRDGLGRALVPGCGRGADALYAASLGADVTGWDLSATAVAAARAEAKGRGLTATFVPRDALAPEAADLGAFDTWIEHTFFCALPPELRPRYIEAAAAILRPGGLLLGVFFVGDTAGGPPYGATIEDLGALFTPRFRPLRHVPATTSPGMWAGREVVAAFQRLPSPLDRSPDLRPAAAAPPAPRDGIPAIHDGPRSSITRSLFCKACETRRWNRPIRQTPRCRHAMRGTSRGRAWRAGAAACSCGWWPAR